MALRMSWWAVAALLGTVPPASLHAQPAAPQADVQPYRTVSVLGLLGRVVEDAQGQPVGVVRDVVMAREGFGPVLALLEVRPPDGAGDGSGGTITVALPAHDLGVGADGIVRLRPGAPEVTALPEISHPPSPAAGGVAPDPGLMVATPGGDLPQVQPQTATPPQPDNPASVPPEAR